MDSEPRFLDLQDELYPQIVILKQIIFENTTSNTLTQYCTQIKYNSFKREIDLTPIIFKYFIENRTDFLIPPSKNQNYEILIKQRDQEKYYFIGIFPQDDLYVLGQQFLSEEILHFVVRSQEKPSSQYLVNEQEVEKIDVTLQKNLILPQSDRQSMIQLQCSKQQQEQSQNSKAKPNNKRRTIQEVLKLIAQWRKLIIHKKLSSSQAAQIVKMSKRSLEDYYNTINLAEKYGFDFQSKMKCGFGELRNFVKQNHQIKPAPKVQILEKFKQMKK